MLPHLGHFCRLVLAAQSHDAHLQFTRIRPLNSCLTQFSPVPFEMQVANAHQLNFGSQSENGIMFQTYNIGDGDFTFRLTLGIIPDPDLILGVLYHEATIARGWIINSSHGLGVSNHYLFRSFTIVCSIYGDFHSGCTWHRGKVCRPVVSFFPKLDRVWFQLCTFHSRD